MIFGSFSIPHTIKVYQLERLIDQVEVCIADGDLDTARIKANQIIDDSGWSTESELKYATIRNSLLAEIEKKEVAMGYKICIGAPYKEYVGLNYLDVYERLQGKGFENIKLIPIEDLVTGWITDDGEIEEITIDGDDSFSEESLYPPDVEIVISYHTFKDK